MALPKINTLPKYDVTIPSLGIKTKLRPYLVKEEKAIMIARETGDDSVVLNTVTDTILACIDEPLKKEQLSIFDIEYLILKIRSKSVGENVKLNLKCLKDDCKGETEYSLNLDDIKLDKEIPSNVINIAENVDIEMKFPTIKEVTKITNINDPSIEEAFNLITSCIVAIKTEEERFVMKDASPEEVTEFLDGLTSAQFEKLSNFVIDIPKLSHNVEYVCPKCETENKIVLEGIDSFFM